MLDATPNNGAHSLPHVEHWLAQMNDSVGSCAPTDEATRQEVVRRDDLAADY